MLEHANLSGPASHTRDIREKLGESEWARVLAHATEHNYDAGAVMIDAGEHSHRIHLILEGVVAIEPATKGGPPGPPVLRREGELVGMLAFFTGAANELRVRCQSPCRAAVLDRKHYDGLLDDDPDLWRRLQEIGLQRMRNLQLSIHLDRVFGPFGVVLPYVLQDLKSDIEWVSLRSGDTLYHQGDASDGAYVLITGRLQIAKELPDGREVITNTALAGETVGEVALLTGAPHAHTVYAARDSELARLSNHSFELMLKRNSKAINNVSKILGKRLATDTAERDPKRTPISCIALIPATPAVDLQEFAAQFQSMLSGFGAARCLDSGTIEQELGAPAIAQADENEAAGLRLTDWLHHEEARQRFLIYRGDQEWNAWSARCVRQTDEVVVIADATGTHDLAHIEKHLSGPRQRWSLVLLHSASTDRPRGTADWLKGSTVESVYHVRRGHGGDMARLVRILTGNAISLVLGGGGARGFAHIGVYRAMEELGIPVDMVCGTSMGAGIAGLIAQGISSDEALARSKPDFRSVTDVTLPVASIIAGRRISDTVKILTGEWDIEDYWLPYFCVATSITTAQAVIHRRGDSWRAIRSSVSIPGVMPPVPFDNEYLVDGGVLNNVPVDIMREMNPFGTVIAVDVASYNGPAPKVDHETELSGWGLLAGRLLPWQNTVPVPSIGSTMLQSMVAGSALKRQEIVDQELADVYLNIGVEGVGMLQFDAQKDAAEKGYESSFKILKDWLETQPVFAGK